MTLRQRINEPMTPLAGVSRRWCTELAHVTFLLLVRHSEPAF